MRTKSCVKPAGSYPTAIFLLVVMVCALLTEAQAQSKKITVGTFKGQVSRIRSLAGYVPHGQIKLFHPNGKLALKGQYLNGKPDGLWTRWYSNGARFGTYRYVNGELDGQIIQYWKSGKIARAAFYRAGKPSGQSIIFSSQQKVKTRGYYLNTTSKSFSLRYRYLCDVRAGAQVKCKSVTGMEDDLATFLSGDELADLLDVIDGLYDQLGLDQGADALASCGANRVSAFSVPSVSTLSSTVGRGGRGDMGNLLESLSSSGSAAVDPEALANRAAAACGGVTGRTGSGSDGSSDASRPDSKAVNRAVDAMQNAVDSCRESQAEKWFGQAAAAGGGGGAGGAGAAGLSGVGGAATEGFSGAIADQIVERLFKTALDDGYVKHGSPLGEGKTKHVHESNPEDYKIVDKLNGTTEYHTGNELGGETVTTVYDEPKSEDLYVYKEWTKKDDKGNVVETGRVVSYGKKGVLPTSLNPLAQKLTEVTKPNGDGTTTTRTYDEDGKEVKSGVGRPAGAGPSRCEQIKAAWETFKRLCDRASWQTYECDQFVRTLNSCVDTAEITPKPEGDATCDRRSQKERDMAERAACESKKGIMILSPDGRDKCDKPTVSRAAFELDICSDPQAMCRPDAALEEAVMTRELIQERPPN